MKVALYVGTHDSAPLPVRIGAWLTRLAQKGPFGRVTHVEAVLEEHGDGTFTVGSSLMAEDGVRVTRKALPATDWVIIDVPAWDASRAARWFAAHAGEPYDWRGAAATVLPGHASRGWFCNEAVGAAVGLWAPANFTPAQFAAIAYTVAGLLPVDAGLAPIPAG